MEQQTYLLHFEGISEAEANHLAEELRHALLDATPDIIVRRKRANPLTMDSGTILQIVLNASAITATVTAIGNWLQLRSKASLTIETTDQKVIAQNIRSKDAARLAELMLTHWQKEQT